MPVRLMAPKSVSPMSWGCSGCPGTDHGPLCTSGTVMTEHTVDWRCARSVPASDDSRATRAPTTLCDDPVSTTKLRLGPAPNRTATLSETSPSRGVTVSGTVVPFPLVSAVGGGPDGPVYDVDPLRGGPSGPGSTSAPGAKSMRTAPKRESTSEPIKPTGSPFPPIWGSVAAVSCCGARVIPSRDHVPTATGVAVPVQPMPAKWVAGPADERCSRLARPASMVDCPAPESRTKGNGPRPPMQTSRDSATWPATVLTVSGTCVAPPGSAVAPLHPAEAGGTANVTCGSMCTAGCRGPLTAAASASASTAAAMATMAAVSRPRRPLTSLVREGEPDGRHRHTRPQHDRRQRQRHPAPALRGPEREAEGRPVVGHHHAVRVAGGAHALDMGHLRRAGEAHAPPRVVGAPAQVHVLRVHEVRLVEAA